MGVIKTLGVVVLFPLLAAKCDPLGLENIKQSAESLERGMKEVGAIDPAGLKKLMTDNERLRAQLDTVMATYSKYRAQDGIIVLKGQDLLLRFKSRVGDMTLNVWVDDPANTILHNRTVSRGDTYNFWPSVEPVDLGFPKVNLMVPGDKYKAQAMAAFDKFLTTTDVLPLPDVPELYLNQTLRSAGVHTIYVNAKPEATLGKNWSITCELFLREEKSERVMKSFTINNKDPGQIAMLIEVQSGDTDKAAILGK
jgi:hypothetical protein